MDFFVVGITWDKAAEELKTFYNGVVDDEEVNLGVWLGNLSNTQTVIGAESTVPINVWSGFIGPVLLANRAFTPAEIADASIA